MTLIENLRRNWLSNVRGDLLAGIVVALALIPEAIGFSIIAGVDPKVGLYASVIIAMVIAITGGRPAMISAATAATWQRPSRRKAARRCSRSTAWCCSATIATTG